MEWLPFALFGYLIWSGCNLLGKILISHHVKSITVNLIGVGIWNLLPLLLIPSQKLVIPSFDLLALALLSGIIYIFILIPYFKALAIEEASRVIPLWRFTPLFILLFSGGLTGESLDAYQLTAFFLLVVGGLLVSIKSLSDLLRPSRAFYLMLLASMVSGIYSSIAKFVYLRMSFYEGFTLMRVSVALSILGLLLIPRYRREVVTTVRQMRYSVRNMMLVNGFFEFVGLIFCNFAMFLAPVSLVSASAGVQAVFVLIFSILLSLKCPQLLHEDISQSVLTQKGFAIALIIIGTGMISFH